MDQLLSLPSSALSPSHTNANTQCSLTKFLDDNLCIKVDLILGNLIFNTIQRWEIINWVASILQDRMTTTTYYHDFQECLVRYIKFHKVMLSEKEGRYRIWWGFPGGTSGKEPACQSRRCKETQVRSLGWEDPLEEGMATHCSVLDWRIPWTEEPGGLQSMGSQKVGHYRNDLVSIEFDNKEMRERQRKRKRSKTKRREGFSGGSV